MDSLHPSLSQALPLRGYDAEQVLQAPFRAAALGIATFYKKAAENGRKAYSLGYAAALQDVLEYLQAGLDHGTDLPRPQGSEQRMALTIERVMDYIERRQDALRAESADSGEEEASHNQANSQHTQPAPSAASASSAASSVTVQAPQAKGNPQVPPSAPDVNPQVPPSAPGVNPQAPTCAPDVNPQITSCARKTPGPPLSASASSHHAIQPSASARRTSPRRTAPSRSTTVTRSAASLSPSLPSATPPVLPPTINYNFTPAAAFPPQFHPLHHSHSHISTPNSFALGARRIRGVGSASDGRKGKTKERAERDRPVVTPVSSVSSVVELNPLQLEGRKRRFPIELSPGGLSTPNEESEDVEEEEMPMMDVESRPSKRHHAARRLH